PAPLQNGALVLRYRPAGNFVETALAIPPPARQLEDRQTATLTVPQHQPGLRRGHEWEQEGEHAVGCGRSSVTHAAQLRERAVFTAALDPVRDVCGRLH